MRFKDNVSKDVIKTLIKDIAKYILGISKIEKGEKMITDFDYTKLPSFDIGLEKNPDKIDKLLEKYRN